MEDDFKNRSRGFTYGFGNFGPNFNFGFNGNDEFFNSFYHHDFDQMFHDMENFMNNIGFPMISNIEYIQNEPYSSHEFDENKSGNLRNMFLKSPEEFDKEAPLVSNEFNKPWTDDSIFKPSHLTNHQTNQHKDINNYFKRDITEDNKKIDLKPVFTTPALITTGQSYSIRRIQRPDGSIEEIKTIRNSDGVEEKTVTRKIGDKVHSVVEKKSPKGVDETEEIFQNFDEDKIGEFNKMWENFPSTDKKAEDPNLIDKRENKPLPNGLISKIFSWFK